MDPIDISEAYLFDVVPCFISVQDKDFRIRKLNRRFREYFGDRKGHYCYEAYKRRSSRCEICPVAETFSDGLKHTSEEIVATSGGEPINVLVHSVPLIDEQGNIYAVMEMSTDITEIKKIESQMTGVGQMMSNLAHTIKGIITGLEGGMYVVESGLRNHNEETTRKGWEAVQRNVGRVSQLVLDMLFYVKDRVPEREEINLSGICREIIDLYSGRLKDNSININLVMDDEIPLKCEPKSIYTLFLNLTENAIDACRWDTSKHNHEITWQITEEKKAVVITVTDTGIGMSEETKSKLFTALYSTKGNTGTGFGLMVARKIVEEHGGEITADSKENEFTRFIIRLPK